MNTPPTPPISPDYMRAHLDDLAREVALLRAMVARQRERIGNRHDMRSAINLSAARAPVTSRADVAKPR